MKPYDFYCRVWEAMMKACLACNASISHHHGIGIIRKKWLKEELKERMKMLQKIKAAIDANNIMNPGKMGGENGED